MREAEERGKLLVRFNISRQHLFMFSLTTEVYRFLSVLFSQLSQFQDCTCGEDWMSWRLDVLIPNVPSLHFEKRDPMFSFCVLIPMWEAMLHYLQPYHGPKAGLQHKGVRRTTETSPMHYCARSRMFRIQHFTSCKMWTSSPQESWNLMSIQSPSSLPVLHKLDATDICLSTFLKVFSIACGPV